MKQQQRQRKSRKAVEQRTYAYAMGLHQMFQCHCVRKPRLVHIHVREYVDFCCSYCFCFIRYTHLTQASTVWHKRPAGRLFHSIAQQTFHPAAHIAFVLVLPFSYIHRAIWAACSCTIVVHQPKSIAMCHRVWAMLRVFVCETSTYMRSFAMAKVDKMDVRKQLTKRTHTGGRL